MSARILIIEDEALVAMELRFVLEDLGHEVVDICATAKAALAGFWRRISHAAAFSPLQPSPWDRLTHNHALDSSPAFLLFDLMTKVVSPYQLNPWNWNPLRHVLEQSVDFERLRERAPVKLFLAATNVRTGKVKVFTGAEITPDAVMASACLPFLFQAVEIDGEAYWDGGYMGNPAIYPLIYHCASTDVLVVHINPLCRPDLPRSATEIMNRINEISFNSSLMRDLRTIRDIQRLARDEDFSDPTLRNIADLRIHMIVAGPELAEGGSAGKLDTRFSTISRLHGLGRDAAARWLDEAFEGVGTRSTARSTMDGFAEV